MLLPSCLQLLCCLQAQQPRLSERQLAPQVLDIIGVWGLQPVSCLLATVLHRMGWALTCGTVWQWTPTWASVLPADRNRAQGGLPPEVQDYLEMIELQDSQPLDLNPRHGVRWG